jgi:hypothetical protein
MAKGACLVLLAALLLVATGIDLALKSPQGYPCALLSFENLYLERYETDGEEVERCGSVLLS